MANSTPAKPENDKQFALGKINSRLKQAIKDFARNDSQVLSEGIKFACECSDDSCHEQLKLSIKTYEKYHHLAGQHIIKKGHQNPTTERIVINGGRFLVVTKI